MAVKDFTDQDFRKAISMGKAGHSMTEIAEALGHARNSMADAFHRWGVKLPDLPWEADGVKGSLMISLCNDGASKFAIQTKIGCAAGTLATRLRQHNLTPKEHNRTPAQIWGTWNGGKAARASMIAKEDKIAARAAVTYEEIDRAQRPCKAECHHITNIGTIEAGQVWKRLEYCLEPVMAGSRFCSHHHPLQPVSEVDEIESHDHTEQATA